MDESNRDGRQKVSIRLPNGREAVPAFLAKQIPATTEIMVVDTRVPLRKLLESLTQAGFHVVASKDGRLVVTEQPEDFR